MPFLASHEIECDPRHQVKHDHGNLEVRQVTEIRLTHPSRIEVEHLGVEATRPATKQSKKQAPRNELPKVRPISPPMDVPVFNIVIYVSEADGKVEARVANLPDLCFHASSEPLALKQAITEVKRRLAAWHSAAAPIPWIDPVPPPDPNETQRFVPVHL